MKRERTVPVQDLGLSKVPTEEEVRAFFYGHEDPNGFAIPKQIDWIEELDNDTDA